MIIIFAFVFVAAIFMMAVTFKDYRYCGFQDYQIQLILTALLLVAMDGIFFSYWLQPHNNRTPKIDDVNNGEARLVTTKVICNEDTVYQYRIEWNDKN